MSNARTIRLVRAPSLRAVQRAIAVLVSGLSLGRARAATIVVPSASAATQLRRTVERLLFGSSPPSAAETARLGVAPPTGGAIVCWPDVVTRATFHARLHARLGGRPPLLDEFERETLMRAAAHAAVRRGAAPPFLIRPGLVSALLRFYDAVARLRRSVDDVERSLVSSLEDEAETDSGAARLLEQTRFVIAAFRDFDARMLELDGVDEHRVRARALDTSLARPYRHVIVTTGDIAADRAGLWPADFDLLTRLRGLERIDIVVTDGMLGAGLYERLEERLPGIEEIAFDALEPLPVLEAPDGAGAPRHFVSRDREEELADLVRTLKWELDRHPLAPPPDARAIVVQRPLPYLYLARHTLDAARVPWTAADSLPLAAEPYAAAVDLACEVPTGGFTRAAVMALLRSPQFQFADEAGDALSVDDVGRLDGTLEAAGFFGGAEVLCAILESRAEQGRAADAAPASRALGRAARVALDVVTRLAAFSGTARLSDHADRLLAFLAAHESPPRTSGDSVVGRYLRARAAIPGALGRLRDAARALDDPVVSFGEVVATLRRWIESRTFEPRVGDAGVHVLDAAAARYADVDVVALLGLIEGDWPERGQPDVLFPTSMLNALGWPREADRITAARAAFGDLLRLARSRVSVSTFTLEDDVLVQPAVLLDELEECGLQVARRLATPPTRVFADEGLVHEPPFVPPGAADAVSSAFDLRLRRPSGRDRRFHGYVGTYRRGRHAVTQVDTYLDCPFRFFAERVLGLEDEREDEPGLSPRERGEITHRIFQVFFERWHASGQAGITTETLGAARRLLADVVDDLLRDQDEADAVIERARLLGSAASPSLGERVLRYEADREGQVIERRLEEVLDGTYDFGDEEIGAIPVAVRGKADRVDLLDGGDLVLVDYKTGRAPDNRSIQLPVYALVAERRLAGYHGRTWRARAADYLAFRGRAVTRALGRTAGQREERLSQARRQFVGAVQAIGRGEFPPRPIEVRFCTWCPYERVCRKDYEGETHG